MMDIKLNKYVAYSVIVVLVALVAFNFESITGNVAKVDKPTKITITNLKGTGVLNDRMVARLSLKDSFPNQRIRVYRGELDKFVGYSFKSENCVTVGSSTEYDCEADLYITDNELEHNEVYYFQAMDRKNKKEGNKAFFTFRK
jgi:hypothetical protein